MERAFLLLLVALRKVRSLPTPTSFNGVVASSPRLALALTLALTLAS